MSESAADRWAAFVAALETPPRRLPRLAKLLGEPGPFDTGNQ
jgi:hypothetical protein